MKAEIICIIDKSGSMAAIIDDAIGGFNTFIEEQKKVPGEANLTLVQFNTDYLTVHENVPLGDVPPLNRDTYCPGGMTALLDAIGTTVDGVGNRLNAMSESARPDKVIVAILTDGQENSSNKYTLDRVKEMITHQREKYQWEFIFLAANQDAFAAGVSLGVEEKNTFAFAATGVGVRGVYKGLCDTVTSYRA